MSLGIGECSLARILDSEYGSTDDGGVILRGNHDPRDSYGLLLSRGDSEEDERQQEG